MKTIATKVFRAKCIADIMSLKNIRTLKLSSIPLTLNKIEFSIATCCFGKKGNEF